MDLWLSDEQVAATVVDEEDKGSATDGLECDDAGNVYLTAYEHDALFRRSPDGTIDSLALDRRLLWPDSTCISTDGHL